MPSDNTTDDSIGESANSGSGEYVMPPATDTKGSRQTEVTYRGRGTTHIILIQDVGVCIQLGQGELKSLDYELRLVHIKHFKLAVLFTASLEDNKIRTLSVLVRDDKRLAKADTFLARCGFVRRKNQSKNAGFIGYRAPRWNQPKEALIRLAEDLDKAIRAR